MNDMFSFSMCYRFFVHFMSNVMYGYGDRVYKNLNKFNSNTSLLDSVLLLYNKKYISL